MSYANFLPEPTGRLPGRRSAVELAAPHVPFVLQSAQILEQAVMRPQIPLYPRVSRQLQSMLEAALTGGSLRSQPRRTQRNWSRRSPAPGRP